MFTARGGHSVSYTHLDLSAAGTQRLSASRAFPTGSAHGADLSVGEIAAADPRLRSSDRASK